MIMKIKLWINWPIKKHKHSDILVSNIDGPTSPKILPTWSHMGSSSHFGFLSYVWIKIKILSTPTANTKNGITCNTYVLYGMYTGKIILHSIFFDTHFDGEECRWHSYVTKYTKRASNRCYYNDNTSDAQHYFAVCLKSIMKNSIRLEKYTFRVKKKNLRNILSRNILSRSEPRTRKQTLSRNWSSLLLPLLSMIVPTHPRSIFPSYTRYPWTLVSL